jgi:hypothetical protein
MFSFKESWSDLVCTRNSTILSLFSVWSDEMVHRLISFQFFPIVITIKIRLTNKVSQRLSNVKGVINNIHQGILTEVKDSVQLTSFLFKAAGLN